MDKLISLLMTIALSVDIPFPVRIILLCVVAIIGILLVVKIVRRKPNHTKPSHRKIETIEITETVKTVTVKYEEFILE